MFLLYFFWIQLFNDHATGNIDKLSTQAGYSESTYFETRTSSEVIDHTETASVEVQSEHVSKNWTKDQLATLLEEHGYSVRIGHDGWPLGMMADVAYYPEDLLPELGVAHGRRNLMAQNKLWVNGDQDTIVPYYYDTASQADQAVFEAAVKTWADNTCIQFAKQPPNACSADLGQAAVCVGNFGGCWSLLGKKYGPGMQNSQQMSVQPDGCEVAAAAHEFGHALGLCHEMARADRDTHIHVMYENIELDLNKLDDKTIKGGWFQGGMCTAEQMYDAPKPYDPMSLMQYGTSDFAGKDQRPVYVIKEPRYQYMFNYHRQVGYVQSHYDNLIMNLGYNCVPKWKKSCEASGQTVPKCQNYGYIGKNCKCVCPAGFSGDTCGTKDGPIFPVMDRAKTMLDIKAPGLVDLKGKGMHDENHNYPRDDFVKWQFITVIITSGEDQRVSAEVTQNNFKQVEFDFNRCVDYWLKSNLDCDYGLDVYVGHSESGRLRVECISSMLNNEIKGYETVLRSRTNELDIMGVGGWALAYSGGGPTVRKAMEFQFQVTFHDKPEVNLEVEQKNPGKVGATVDKATKAIHKAIENALGTKNTTAIIIGGVVGLLLLIAGAGGGAYWWFKIRKPADGEGESGKESHLGALFSGGNEKAHSSEGDDSDSSD